MGASSSQQFQIPETRVVEGLVHIDNSRTGKLRKDFLEFKDSLGYHESNCQLCPSNMLHLGDPWKQST